MTNHIDPKMDPEIKGDLELCVKTAQAEGKTKYEALNCDTFSVGCAGCPLVETKEDRQALAEAILENAYDQLNKAERTGLMSQITAARMAVVKARHAVAFPTMEEVIKANGQIQPNI